LPDLVYAGEPVAREPRLVPELFGVDASQPLSAWRNKGWIHPDDPRGWFRWYWRYHIGRRMPEEARQIRPWTAIRPLVAQLRRHCEPGDFDVPPAPGASALGV
jgi:hypothetical protein